LTKINSSSLPARERFCPPAGHFRISCDEDDETLLNRKDRVFRETAPLIEINGSLLSDVMMSFLIMLQNEVGLCG
jgi:hypothetical protein